MGNNPMVGATVAVAVAVAESKNKGTPNISQNQDFSGAPPTRFFTKRVGDVMVMLNFFA